MAEAPAEGVVVEHAYLRERLTSGQLQFSRTELETNPLLSFRERQIKRNRQLLKDLGLTASVAEILSRRDGEKRSAEAEPAGVSVRAD